MLNTVSVKIYSAAPPELGAVNTLSAALEQESDDRRILLSVSIVNGTNMARTWHELGHLK